MNPNTLPTPVKVEEVALETTPIVRQDYKYPATGRKDGRIVILIFTSSESKKAEFQATLGNKYGCNLVFRDPPNAAVAGATASPEAVGHRDAIEAIKMILRQWDANQLKAASPHWVLREQCQLRCMRTNQVLDATEVVQHPESAPNFISDESFMAIWRPKWNYAEGGKLDDISSKYFTHNNEGYLEPSYKEAATPTTFGWDHLFVVARLGKTYDQMRQMTCGKIASRQLTLSSFIHRFLLYDKPKSLSHNKGQITHARSAVEFTHESAVHTFLCNNKFTSNEARKKWRLDRFQTQVLNEGVYFKAATSRPMGNFFSPPFGIPITPKKDAVEETVFMQHDLGHQHIPDLIYEGQNLKSLPDKEAKEILNVYSIWRMMSEAITLVQADMLYASSLAEADPENIKCLDDHIYPLYLACIDKASVVKEGKETGSKQQTAGGDSAATATATRPAAPLEIIHRLMHASVLSDLCGDWSAWESMVSDMPEGAEDDPSQSKALRGPVKVDFTKFSVGDWYWTAKNFEHMCEDHALYKSWNETVGIDRFKAAGLPRVSEVIADVRQRLSSKGQSDSILSGPINQALVTLIFDHLFETLMVPVFGFSNDERPIEAAPEEVRLGRAFRRYIICQLYFYARFEPALPELKQRATALVALLDEVSVGCEGGVPTSHEKREKVRRQFEQDVRRVWGAGLITASAAESYMQLHPLFEPVYIPFSTLIGQTVPDTLEELYGSRPDGL